MGSNIPLAEKDPLLMGINRQFAFLSLTYYQLFAILIPKKAKTCLIELKSSPLKHFCLIKGVLSHPIND